MVASITNVIYGREQNYQMVVSFTNVMYKKRIGPPNSGVDDQYNVWKANMNYK